MRFSRNKHEDVRNANNLCKAYRITGRIIRNTQSLAALPFYRSLLLYRGLMQLEKSAKSTEAFMKSKPLIDDGRDLEKVMQLKKAAAHECYNCLRDDQLGVVSRAKAWSDKWRITPISRFLGKLIEAYADVRATRRGEETPLPPAAFSKAPKKENGGNAYRGEMRAQALLERFFQSACRIAWDARGP